MSGLKQLVEEINLGNLRLVTRPSQVYDAAVGGGIYPMFAVRNGAVILKALVGRHTAVSGGATTLACTITGGITLDNAGVPAINGAVGTIVIVPLNAAAAIAAAAVGAPMTDALLHPKGFVCGLQPANAPTFIIGTYAVSTVTMEWSIVYQKLSLESIITLQ